MTETAIIGGTGFGELAGLVVGERVAVDTPFGAASAGLVFGELAGREVVFLARHGDGAATIAPHRINYRANIWALREAGARRVVGLAAVGGISRELAPGSVVIPHQIIDYTWGREHTFFDGGGLVGGGGGLSDDDGGDGASGNGGEVSGASDDARAVKHIEFASPYSASLRGDILTAAATAGVAVSDGGVYAATQGPRLETAAEVERLARDGADVVGMTAMPEAALAREIGLEYATVAMVVNPAAGRGAATTMAMIAGYLEVAGRDVVRVLEGL